MYDRYIRYNEITFAMYCMTSIDRAISRGRREKNRRAQAEISLEDLGDLDNALGRDRRGKQV